MAGEEAGLELGQEADGGFFVEKRVGDFVLFAFLPGGEDFFAGIVFEQDGSVLLDVEVFEGDLLAIEERERGAVGEEGAEFFHQVEGEGRAAGAVAVEEAALGIESAGFEGAAAVVHEQGVEEGEESVHRIERRAARATGNLDRGVMVDEEVGKNGEVAGGGIPLNAAQRVEAGGTRDEADADGEEICGIGESKCAFWGFLAMITGGTHQDVAGVCELGGDHVGRDGE